ncbi:MAG: zinc-dependent metalloprotease, partial [Phycisphaerales bacterium]|nr:zinc-dependent metalloprotease [Phycisphaerales bacterium]
MKVLSALGAMGIAASSVFGLEAPITVDQDRSNEVMTALTLDADVMEQLRFEDRMVLEAFPLDTVTSVDLDLQRRDVFDDTVLVLASGDQEFPFEAPDLHAFGGTVGGDPSSLVFLAFSDYGLEGIIDYQGETWVISRGERDDDPIAIYNLTTLPEGVINWAEFVCHADEIQQPVLEAGPVTVTTRGDECRRIEIAIDTDQEYLGIFGGDEIEASVYLGTLLGAISEVYVRDVFTYIDVVYLRLWDSIDPWTGGDTVDELLAVSAFWEANMGHINRDVVHFISGRGLGGGVAWLPGLCNGPYAYAVSANIEGRFPYPRRDNDSRNWDFMVVAHELGHNCGGPHTHDQTPRIDNCAGGDCTVTPNGTIMSYCHLCPGGLSNIKLQFHPQTINSYMLPFLRGLGCEMDCRVGLKVTYPGEAPTEIRSDEETDVTVFVTGTLTQPVPETATLHYNVGDGWLTAPIEHVSGLYYNAVLPPVECGGAIDYYVRIQGDNGQWYRAPGAGEFVHAISAVSYRDIYRANFETDAGFTTEHVDLIDGEWERVVPTTRGIRFTPDNDYDG